ncbi:MAG: hypothetical protein NC321_04140 [Clostridium sp.]|nr:hypothetical protein [Clostridium sp.]
MRRDNFEDDGRTVADMSALENTGIFRRRSHSSQTEKKSVHKDENAAHPWEDAPFSWKERIRYMGVALGAALSIAFVLLAGIALIIWLLTLYA